MVSAAPLLPRSSLTTWTSITCRRLLTSWILYWRRGRNARSGTSSSTSSPADGFDDLFLGLFAVVFILVFVVVLVVLWHQRMFDVIKHSGLAGGVLCRHGVFDMGCGFAGLFRLDPFVPDRIARGDRRLDYGTVRHFRMRSLGRRFGYRRGRGYVVVISRFMGSKEVCFKIMGLKVTAFMMTMFMIVMMMVVIRMLGIGMIAVGFVLVTLVTMGFMICRRVVRMFVVPIVLGVLVIPIRLRRLRWVECIFDDRALDAVAAAAPSRIAVTGTAPVAGAVLAFLFGFAMGALVSFDQRLTISNRDLVLVRMNFAEREEAVAVAAIFNEGGLRDGPLPA